MTSNDDKKLAIDQLRGNFFDGRLSWHKGSRGCLRLSGEVFDRSTKPELSRTTKQESTT